jgi:hypothetical protein
MCSYNLMLLMVFYECGHGLRVCTLITAKARKKVQEQRTLGLSLPYNDAVSIGENKKLELAIRIKHSRRYHREKQAGSFASLRTQKQSVECLPVACTTGEIEM